jgi:hypothetical protein
MSDPNTLRILEIDGGGERGYLSLNFLQKFIQLWGIDPTTIAKQFDVICGTSVGGLVALAFALGLTPNELLPFFTVQGPYIFTLGTSTGLPPIFPFPPSPSIRPSLPFKIALMVANTPFYSSSGYYINDYGSGLLVKTIQDLCGTNTLQNLQTNVIIPSYQNDTSTYVLFSNLNYPNFIGQDELVSNVALATSAAPVYLPPVTFGGHTYIDGGVFNNNPAEFGLTAGKMIKPNASRYCVLSIGTGAGEKGFASGGVPPPPSLNALFKGDIEKANKFKYVSDMLNDHKVGGPLDTIYLVYQLGAIARVGSQESTNESLFLESTYTLDNLFYYRFNPDLDKKTYDTELDSTDPVVLQYYHDTAVQVFNDDIENISTFLGHLTA